MCGIIGSFSKNPNYDIRSRLEIGIGTLKHRGPDDVGREFFATAGGTLALGHLRLSILDLSKAGHQPMFSKNERFCIVFNGEIYNYKEIRSELLSLGFSFNSNSDTEVLIASWEAWGMNCLSKLVGMFSFVLYDKELNQLIGVRDPFGIKPFYYNLRADAFYFASELPGVLGFFEEKPKLNYQKSYDFLLGKKYDMDEETFFNGIFQLMPGHLMTVNLDDLKATVQKWWEPKIEVDPNITFEQSKKEIREKFLENVKLHLRSDVPIGAALSGGIDSTAIVCAMRHLEPDIPIYTFSYIAKDSNADEEKWVNIANDHIHAVAKKVVVSQQELARDLEDMIKTQGAPFGSTSIYAQYRVFKLAKDSGVTVTLDGQGADELLAGYDGYPQYRIKSMLNKAKIGRVMNFVYSWGKYPGRNLSHSFRNLLVTLLGESNKRNLNQNRIKNNHPWINFEFFKNADKVSVIKDELATSGSDRVLMNKLRTEVTQGGLLALLRHGDRNSMRWSVESRVPFLTTDFAEYIFSLPENFLISDKGETKHIFREAMRGIVPDAILDRKDKVGFVTPEKDLLFGENFNLLKSLDICKDYPFFSKGDFEEHLNNIKNGKIPYNHHIWRMINFCKWLEIFRPAL